MQEQQEGESLLNRIHHYRDDHVVGNTTSTNTHQQRANENLTSENNHEQVDNNDSEEVSLHVEHFTEAHPINTGAEEEISHDEQQYSNPQSGGVRKGLFGRRAWDDQVYQQRAAERLEREKGGVDTDEKRKVVQTRSESLQRKPLQARESRLLNLSDEKLIGKKGVIDVTAEGKHIMPNSKTLIKKKSTREETIQKVDPNELAGFYCSVCDRSFKDSASYVDHCNSKPHLSRLGMTNRAVKASADDVKRKLQEIIDAKKYEQGRSPHSVSSLTALALSRLKSSKNNGTDEVNKK